MEQLVKGPPSLKQMKRAHSVEIDCLRYRELMPEKKIMPSLIIWMCKFCAYQNAYDDHDPELHFCKVCENYQEKIKRDDVFPLEEAKDIDYEDPEEFTSTTTKCPQCGFTFHPEFNEECQCEMNLSQFITMLETLDEESEVEIEKLGLQILEVNGVRGGAIRSRLWYPKAKRVRIMGDFNRWGSEPGFNPKNYEMKKDKSGVFTITLQAPPGVSFIGQRFKYFVEKPGGKFEYRNDPRSVMLVGKKYINDYIYDNNAFQWSDQNHKIPALNSLVIYETHIATLNDCKAEDAFIKAVDKLDYLKKLGINAIELLPITQDSHNKICWGYDVVSLFAVCNVYGTPDDLKRFINEAHKRGISVILDWVPNHICKRTILHESYLYDKKDRRYHTRYGPRPDVSKPEVMEYCLDSLRSWISDFHFDGVRVDSIESMRFITDTQERIVEAWPFMQEVTSMVRKEFPNVILIGEDLQNDARINSIMGFDSQWDTKFFSVVLNAAKAYDDYSRNCYEIAHTLKSRFEASGFGRVIYGESHDTIPADRQLRLLKAIDPCNETPDITAKRRARLAGSLCLVVMGVPMIMAGQELMETRGKNGLIHLLCLSLMS